MPLPYIKQEQRPDLDQIVDLMKKKGVKADGDLNYIIFAFCSRHITPGYGNYKNYRGELRETADEIGRRFLAPYEDIKKDENGDV